MIDSLSSSELLTLKSYKAIAKIRNTTHANPQRWHAAFASFCSFVPRGRILDLGCGTGRDAQLFLPAGYEYVGVDLSDEMLAEARVLCPQARFEKMNMYSLDFPDHSFDGIWAAASLLHIPKKRVHLVLSEIKRVLRQGGIAFISLKEGDGERVVKVSDSDERFFAFYQDKEVREILGRNGFALMHHFRELFEYLDGKKAWLWYIVRLNGMSKGSDVCDDVHLVSCQLNKTELN